MNPREGQARERSVGSLVKAGGRVVASGIAALGTAGALPEPVRSSSTDTPTPDLVAPEPGHSARQAADREITVSEGFPWLDPSTPAPDSLEAVRAMSLTLGGGELGEGWQQAKAPLHIIAGGDMADPKQYEGLVFENAETGVKVIMPSLNAVIPEGLQDKFQELVTQLKPGEVVIPAENGFYVFSGEHGKEVSFVDGEGRVPIEFRTTNPYYKPQLAYFNGMGLVGTDHVRITHVWDSNTQAWRELVTQKPDGKWVNEYVLLGNAEQRNRKRKERLFEAIGHHNLESVKSSSGDEIYIVVGGDYGLKLQGNVDRFKKILGIMMESNPGVTEMLIRFNVLGIAAGTTSQMFSTLYPGYMSSFRNVEGLGNIIECNERILTPDNYPEDIYGMVTVGEARGGYNFDHLVWNFQKQEWVLNSPDRVGGTDDAMLEKSLFFALWVKNDSGLPKERVAEMLKLINFDLPPNLQVSI